MVDLLVEPFGQFEKETVKKFTWKTKSGFTVSAISYGAIIQEIKVPDNNAALADVVLGFDDLDSYVRRNTAYFGAAIGRCSNRIGGAKFKIDGVSYTLTKNNGENQLHGGIRGFDKVNWKTTVVDKKVVFSYYSKDGEEGFPGDVIANVTYEVKEDDSINIEFLATTSKKTVVGMTNHSYFNLAGHETGARELYNHVFTINADKITETDEASIPTGKLVDVGGTPYDLRLPTRYGDVVNKNSKLFDDNFCVSTYWNEGLNFVSRVVHPPSGRYLEVYSDQPGVQLYTSNALPAPSDEALVGKKGVGYRRHAAFCLETQNYPDAINHENFPNAILVPGDVYKHQVIFKFGAVPRDSPRVVRA